MVKFKNSAGKYNLLKQLFNHDDGEYFDKNGNIDQSLGIEYTKTKCWRLIPKRNVDEDDNIETDRNLPRYFSIDGERYPVQPIQVKVLQKKIRIFCLNKIDNKI